MFCGVETDAVLHPIGEYSTSVDLSWFRAFSLFAVEIDSLGAPI